MKFIRFGEEGKEKPGVIDKNGDIRDLSGEIRDIDGKFLDSTQLELVKCIDHSSLPLVSDGIRIAPCVANVGKFICIGLNYADHAAETGAEVPAEPVVFLKATSAICGPNDNIIKPRNSNKLDWEVELGIVIGREASYVEENDAEDYIAGYCLINDVSEREFQIEKSGQWDLGKGCDTFGPIGPWLVTKEEMPDVNNLDMWLEVNGKRYQDGNTKTMIFSPNFIVSYLSQYMSLQPGDVISTGTPPGVGLGQTPPVYLNEGDSVTIEIKGLGSQKQFIVGAK